MEDTHPYTEHNIMSFWIKVAVHLPLPLPTLNDTDSYKNAIGCPLEHLKYQSFEECATIQYLKGH